MIRLTDAEIAEARRIQYELSTRLEARHPFGRAELIDAIIDHRMALRAAVTQQTRGIRA